MGVVEAAKHHGVPQTTVSNWRGRDTRRVTQANRTTKRSKAPRGMNGATDTERAPSASDVMAKPPRATTKEQSRATTKEQPRATTKEQPRATTEEPRVAKSYTPSEKAQALELAAEHGVTEASKRLGISRFSLYAWRRELGKAAKGEGPSPTSGEAPVEIEAQRDREILGEWRKHPGLGPSQIRNQLRRRGIRVAVATVRRVMQDAGYRPPKVERQPHDERFEAVRPNHLWHLDFVHRFINRASAFTLILLDDCSRFVVGHGVDDAERAQIVIDTFEEAVRRHGKPERLMHDRGAGFWSWRGISRFTALLTEMGIDQVVAEEKEHNGKVEVFNANLHKELFDRHRFYDLAEMKRRLAAHLHWYNHARTHHALGGLLVPADRYHGRAEEVLARIEAGAQRDGDELELRDRCLELFKVVSRGGVPEVWLLGKRVDVPLGAQSPGA
jgi:putative transposase